MIVWLVLNATLVSAQTTDPTDASRGRPRVTARDADSRTVEWVEAQTDAVTGQITERTRSYVEVGTGLHHKNESGEWRESQDLIALTDDGGAAALLGQTKVRFQANLNVGPLSITTVSNRIFHTQIIGLYYFDAATGGSALVAPLQDSTGELLPPNQIVYRDAFNGVKADVRFTYTKAGFESDVILLEKPLPPENFGLSSRTARLESGMSSWILQCRRRSRKS